MAVGDSITAGTTGCVIADAWRLTVLQSSQTGGAGGVTFVGPYTAGTNPLSNSHDAVGGSTIANRTGDLSSLVTTYQPDIVAVLLGTNNATSTDVAAVTSDYDSLIGAVRSSLPSVPILAIMPTPSTDTHASFLPSVISQEKAVVASRVSSGDTHLSVVDTSAFSVGQLSGDGLHPSCAGYQALGSIIWSGMRSLVPSH